MKEPVIIKDKQKTGVCSAAHCRNKTPHTLCSTCRSRKARMADPVKYAYYNLRNRAGQRKNKIFPNGIPFTITLDQFRELCHKTCYMAGKGKTAYSYTLDRKYEDIGYHIENIQVRVMRDNVKKAILFYDWQRKEALVWKPLETVPHEDDFF